mgnify:CR=1 FL=1
MPVIPQAPSRPLPPGCSKFYLNMALSQPLKPSKLASLVYHDIFSYPMTERELEYWQMGEGVFAFKAQKAPRFEYDKGFYFLSGRENNISKRIKRGCASQKKIALELKSPDLKARLPSLLVLGITGSLAIHLSLIHL